MHTYHTLVYSSFDAQLRDFENASRELGSSVGIVWSAFRLQERLAKILFLFRENAAYLYPRKIMRKEVLLNPNIMDRRQDWRNRSTVPISQDNLELDMLPNQLESLAGDVVAFISCLNEFEEFNDEAISQSMRSFEGDLRVRRIPHSFPLVSHLVFDRSIFRLAFTSTKVSALSQLMCVGYIVSLDQFRSSAVQRYVHDLMHEIGGHLDEITSALTIFIEIGRSSMPVRWGVVHQLTVHLGIPTIWFHQQHAAKNLLNVSTLSIVFGAVDASLLVLSSHTTGNILANSVNMFWMSSLLFSIAGGVNGLLGLTWKQSV